MICSTNKLVMGTIPGHALCVVRLADVVPFTKDHLQAACMGKMPDVECYAWILEDLRYIRPVKVKGRLGLWNYDGPVEYLEEPKSDEEDEKLYREVYEPLFV